MAILTLAAACKKEKNETGSPYVGTWRVASDTLLRYYIFVDDGTMYNLAENVAGIHSSSTTFYKTYTNGLLYFGTLSGSRFSGDSLILSETTETILIKSTPIDPTGWVGTVSTSNQIAMPLSVLYFGALEWDGTQYLLSNFSKRIYKMTDAGVFTDSTNILVRSYGICTHGGNIWTNGYSTDGKLRIIDFATGNATTFSSAYSSSLAANTSDGTYIWSISEDGKLVYYNPLTDVFTVKSTLTTLSGGGGGPPSITDMAIKDGFAYCGTLLGIILKIDLSTGMIVRTYQSTGLRIVGLTFKDGQLKGICTDLSTQLFLADITLN